MLLGVFGETQLEGPLLWHGTATLRPPERDGLAGRAEGRGLGSLKGLRGATEDSPGQVPRGTTMSASRMVGWMYWSKAGLTNLLYCLMTPSMSRPRSLMSLRRRRTKRMSESVSTKIFRSRS